MMKATNPYLYALKNLFLAITLMLSFSGLSYAALCESSATSTSYEWIESVEVGTFSHTSANNNGYANFTSTQTIPLEPGQHSISLNPGFRYGSYTEHWRAWIDFNQDDILESSELVFSSGTNATASGTITVPDTAVPGLTTMRVSMKYGSPAAECGNFYWGEVEDYSVEISNGTLPAAVPTAFTLNVDNNYVLSRTGELGDSVNWVIEKDGVIALTRNASSELTYQYFNNTTGSKFRVWLAIGNQQASNIVEYEAGTTVSTHQINLEDNYAISRNGLISEPLTWVIEQDGLVVLRRNAANEFDYTYFDNVTNSYYRVWLEQFVNGAYEIVSNVVHYVPGQAITQYQVSINNSYDLIRNGNPGEPVRWVIEENGVTVFEQDASTSLLYSYPGLLAGNSYRAWLVQDVNGQPATVSNVVAFTPHANFGAYSLSIDSTYRLYRSGSLGDNVIWVIEKNGSVVLQRNAANELDFIFFSNTPGSSFRVWLQQFTAGGYYRVSNIIEYNVP